MVTFPVGTWTFCGFSVKLWLIKEYNYPQLSFDTFLSFKYLCILISKSIAQVSFHSSYTHTACIYIMAVIVLWTPGESWNHERTHFIHLSGNLWTPTASFVFYWHQFSSSHFRTSLNVLWRVENQKASGVVNTTASVGVPKQAKGLLRLFLLIKQENRYILQMLTKCWTYSIHLMDLLHFYLAHLVILVSDLLEYT